MSSPHARSQELADYEHGEWTRTQRTTQSLPRVDGGRQAWLFLNACFMLEALVWGFPFSYGVFQVYYGSNPLFAHGGSSIAAIGTTQMGVMYFSTPVVAVMMQRWPQMRRPGALLGSMLLVISLIAASFCNSVDGLLMTQAVMYALGGMLVYFPSIQYIEEWFVAKRGMAFGVMWAGTGSAGIVVPFLLEWLLGSYGFRTTLRVWDVVVAIGLTPCLLFVKGRLPITTSNALRPNDLAFLKWPSSFFSR